MRVEATRVARGQARKCGVILPFRPLATCTDYVSHTSTVCASRRRPPRASAMQRSKIHASSDKT